MDIIKSPSPVIVVSFDMFQDCQISAALPVSGLPQAEVWDGGLPGLESDGIQLS